MPQFLIFAVASVLLALTSPTQAANWKHIDLTLPQGVKNISQSNGRLFVQDQTGQWQELQLVDGKLTLSKSSPLPKPQSNDPDKLPDTEIAAGTKNIQRAWFARPTQRYDHGVLGDQTEAGSLKATLQNGQIAEIILPENAVFEDRIPRIADINQDGADEIIAVKSYLNRGAAVVLVGQLKDRIDIVGEAPAIGLSHRWLNPVGAADFDGDGIIEIAVVITPHIGGTLQLYEWHGKKLVPDHNAFGFSNHAMGSRELGLSAIIDLNQDGLKDILLPDASRRSLIGIGFANAQPVVLQHFDVSGSFSSGLHVADLDQDGDSEVVFATNDNQLTVLIGAP